MTLLDQLNNAKVTKIPRHLQAKNQRKSPATTGGARHLAEPHNLLLYACCHGAAGIRALPSRLGETPRPTVRLGTVSVLTLRKHTVPGPEPEPEPEPKLLKQSEPEPEPIRTGTVGQARSLRVYAHVRDMFRFRFGE